MKRCVAAACMAIAAVLAMLPSVRAQVELYAQGEPYQNGSMTMNVVATGQVGAPVILAYGVSPLPLLQPIVTGKGPFFIGSLLNVLGIGVIGSNGRLDLPFTMPPYTAPGIPVVVQAFVGGSLSNPATIALDAPYFVTANATVIPNPNPTAGASFGDQVAAGDLNGDGADDLAVGAWFEDYFGIDKAGRVYVLWGPEWNSYTALQPPSPKAYGLFGASVTVVDLDRDGIDDLVVAETTGDPPSQAEPGYLHVFLGATSFSVTPTTSIPSAGMDVVYTLFGRTMTVGDFNDDASPDLAVGVMKAVVAGLSNAGRIDVYWGPDFGTRTEIPNPTPTTGDYFGDKLRVTDVNADGIDDLVEGSGRASVSGVTQVGKVHVFSGPFLTLVATVPNPLGPVKNARFAEGIHAADLDADGMPEIIAADVKNRLFILWGPDWLNYTLRKKPPTAFQNPFGESSFGYFLRSLDANQDGIQDLVIADPFSGALPGCSPAAEGSVYMSLGPYFDTFRLVYEPQPGCGDGFSWGLITYDIDGDGREEILAGSDTAEVGSVFNGGRVSVLKP